MTRTAAVTDARADAQLPRWDVSTVWPGLESPEFAEAFVDVTTRIGALATLFDARGIRAGTAPTEPAVACDEIVTAFNDVLDRVWTLNAYLYAFVSTDSRDDEAQARLSELRPHLAELGKLETRLTAWIGGLDVDELLAASPVARDHAFAVRRAKVAAEHLMSEAEESLAADLHLSGAAGWERLHSDLTSQIEVPFAREGQERRLPMSEIRNLAYDADRDVRRSAYDAELSAWERAAVPLAAAMNGVKGEVNTLSARRRWETALDESLFVARIDRATLDAMLGAVRETLPEFRRYLHAKARLLGIERVAWYDLFAPVPSTPGADGSRTWSFAAAEAFIVDQFGTYSKRMSEFAGRAFAERWIDAEPRAGKSDGAFCMSLWKDESRILANYTVSYDGVSTLAHELGHGYHNLVRAPLTQIQRRTPMTLAETASIFCETIVREAALATGSPAEQLEILEASIQGNVQVTVDTLSRFLFERAVFERRRARELSPDELCELMLDAQRETYGDGLDPDALHAYMWAVKPHYYGDVSFYNYPYTFGLLFGLGLYALYERDPDSFRERYDELLASTGQGEAAELAARFGIDITTPEFWRRSLKVLVDDIDRFEKLVEERAAQP